jgi:tetratricopeptide (TPR) repeat protein
MNRALVAYQRGRLDEANRLTHAILSVHSDHFDALHLTAAVKARQRRFAEALAGYDRALAVRPHHPEALNNRGNTLKQLRWFDEALASFDEALAVRPKFAEALNNRGSALHDMKRFDEALVNFDRALAIRPNFAEAFYNRALALYQSKRFGDALASYDRALAIRPDYAKALNNRGSTLKELRRFDEAVASFDRALAVRPDYVVALNNRGLLLEELKRFDAALASYEDALARQPDFADSLNNRGNILIKLKRFDEALASFERALAVRPDYAEAHCTESLLRLLMGDYERGWHKYEWRWRTDELESFERKCEQPLWLGENVINGKTILLHSEQGFGDTIQFCRYVPLVARRGAQVLLDVPTPLRDLMVSLDGIAQVIPRGEELPCFDFHCPLLSLPLAFGTTLETIPSEMPYLTVPPENERNWKTRLGSERRPRIGVAWCGNPLHKDDCIRSMDLKTFSGILDADATFVSLQKDIRVSDVAMLESLGHVLRFENDLRTFADTAALIANLDLVISVDTGVAHLAGALAKPVWVLLPFVPDWRWLLDREDNPWYPTARLFRQNVSCDWSGVINRVVSELKQLPHLALNEYPSGR